METAENYVDAVVEMLRSRGIRVRGVTQIGGAAETVCSVAKRLSATLVTLPVRDPGGLLLGRGRSAAERAVEACSTPMYVLPLPGSGVGATASFSYRRVVVPLDGAPSSLEVIPAAAEFCRRFAAPMLFVHVVPSDPEAWHARGVFRPALRLAEREGIPAETLLGRGDPASEILRYCSELRGSMIAMRTRLAVTEGSGPLGSVTVKVLRSAAVPMLIVHRKTAS